MISDPFLDAAAQRALVTPAQCRAARAWLGWTQAQLAREAGVARKTIADFELTNRILHIRTRAQITYVLLGAGANLIWDDSAGGEGIRFQPTPSSRLSASF